MSAVFRRQTNEPSGQKTGGTSGTGWTSADLTDILIAAVGGAAIGFAGIQLTGSFGASSTIALLSVGVIVRLLEIYRSRTRNQQ